MPFVNYTQILYFQVKFAVLGLGPDINLDNKQFLNWGKHKAVAWCFANGIEKFLKVNKK